jgi:HEPN superfamily AbiU2-like protein
MIDQLYKKWDAWLIQLYGELLRFHTNHHIFWKMQEIIRENPKLHQFPGDFNHHVKGWYETSMALLIRRQAEGDKRVISFRQLLEEIKAHPTAISRDRFKRKFVDSQFSEDRADALFDRLIGEGRRHIDPAQVQSEIEEIEKRSKKIIDYVDRQIAHKDKQGVSEVPNHNDIDEALKYLGELLKRYWLIFRGSTLMSVLPTFQYNWTEIFTLPWIDRGQE